MVHNAMCVFDAAWDARALLFWSGLKKAAPNEICRKRGIEFDEVMSFAACRQHKGTSAGRRDAALAVTLFFGVRRIHEGVSFNRANVRDEHDAIALWVAKQKNDPTGRGQWCWVPNMPMWPCNPAGLVRSWMCEWDSTFTADAPNPAFFSVTGKAMPKTMSTDSWRKVVSAHFSDAAVSTHSFRRGGALWLRHTACVEEDVVQAQGGWANVQVMRDLYAEKPKLLVRKQLLLAMARVPTGSNNVSSAVDGVSRVSQPNDGSVRNVALRSPDNDELSSSDVEVLHEERSLPSHVVPPVKRRRKLAFGTR